MIPDWAAPLDLKLAEKKLPLTIELVPSTCFYDNLRSTLPKDLWDYLRKKTYAKAKNRCEVCHGRGPNWPVECHEIWQYDDKKNVQKLAGLIALCPECHLVKHFGFSQIQGHAELSAEHLAKVNGWTKKQAEKHIESSFERWEERSQRRWDQDLSWLKQFGIDEDDLPKRPKVEERDESMGSEEW